MSKPKTIKVLIEIPSNWVDFDSPLGFLSGTIRQMVERNIQEAIIEQYVKKIDMPDIKVSKEEVKIKIIDKLAERALESAPGVANN